MRRFIKTRTGPFGLLLLLAMVLGSAFGLGNPNLQSYESILATPSLNHPLGTDDLGRDTLSRVLHGGRISLSVGALSVALAMIVGVPIGLLAAFYRGRIDSVLMRIVDGLLSFPSLLLALFLTAVFGASLSNIVIAIGIVFAPRMIRFCRGQALAIRQDAYIEAAQAVGQADLRIMMAHMLPNVSPSLIVQASLDFAFAVLIEASLSFLGVGVPPPTASWGTMLEQGFGYMSSAPWLALAPGVFISTAVLGANLLGDGLRDAWDPRMRGV